MRNSSLSVKTSEMGQPLPDRFRKELARHLPELFSGGSAAGSPPLLIAGVSGGADSVALLRLLKESGVNTLALHCNFHLRGEESDRDQEFVTSLCRSLDVPLEIHHCDVPAYISAHPGSSLEMACRELRYTIFRDEMLSRRAIRIAVAHNQDDNIETLLLNLFRGTGISGLRGMVADTGTIIRPLLSTPRSEIESYLARQGQSFVVDSTNLSSDFKRNFIRNELLPLIETRWPAARQAMARAIANLREDERVLTALYAGIVGERPDILSLDAILPPADIDWAVGRFAAAHSLGNKKDEIIKALSAPRFEGEKIWSGPAGEIRTTRGGLHFAENRDARDSGENREGGGSEMPKFTWKEFSLTPSLWEQILAAPLSELWVGENPKHLLLRHRLPGDRIEPLGLAGSKKVSKLMKDARLTSAEKESRLVAVDSRSGNIIWAEGLCRSSYLLVGPDMKSVWKLEK